MRRCVTMDLKEPATCCIWSARPKTNWAARISPWSRAHGGQVPKVDAGDGPADLRGDAPGDPRGLVRACHDLSEGGLAVAAAEMAFAGGLGMELRPGRRAARSDDLSGAERAATAAVLRIEFPFPVRGSAPSSAAFERRWPACPWPYRGRLPTAIGCGSTGSARAAAE